jgi:hypothetical protein
LFDTDFSETYPEVAALSPVPPAVLHYPVLLVRIVSHYYYRVAAFEAPPSMMVDTPAVVEEIRVDIEGCNQRAIR